MGENDLYDMYIFIGQLKIKKKVNLF